MAFMKFYVGTEASVQEHLDGIYLATDTHKIFYNGSAYGGGDVDLNNYLTKDYLKSYSISIGSSGTGISKQILFNYSQQTTHNGMFYLLSRYTSYANDHTGLLVRNRTGGNSTYGYAAGGVYLTAGGVYSGSKSNFVNPSIRVGELLCTTSSGSDAVDEAGYPRDWGTHSVLSKKDLSFYSDDATNVKLASFNVGGITIKGKTTSDLLHAAGGTISIDELKSKLNIPDTSSLQSAIGTNTYTGANYISKETNLTEAVLQLDEEIKATNDNLDLEHTNAEATYAKKSELDGYAKFSDLVSIYLSKTEASETYQPKGNYLTSVSWSQVSGKPSWIGSSKPSYTWSEIGSKPTFATVATSGSYNDLTNKPTIPSLTGYATQSWVNSQGFVKGSFLPLTGGTLSGDLIRSNSGDVKRAKINNLEISVYDSINTTCKAIMSCTSNYGVVEVGNNLNNKNVHIDANTGITLKGTGVGISLSTGGSSSKFFATDGSVQTINVDNFALKSTTDALTAITENQDKKISSMKLGMARYTSGTTAQVITGDEGTVGLRGTPALYFYNGGISGGTVPISNCIRVKDAQCYVDEKGIYFAFPTVSTEDNGLMTFQDKQYLNWVVNSQFGTTIGMDEPNLTNLAKISSAANYVKTHLSTFITNNTSAELDVIQVLQGFIVGDNVHLKLAISIQDTESQVYTVKPQGNNNIVATSISSDNDYRAIVDLWFIVNNLNFAMNNKYVLEY